MGLRNRKRKNNLSLLAKFDTGSDSGSSSMIINKNYSLYGNLNYTNTYTPSTNVLNPINQSQAPQTNYIVDKQGVVDNQSGTTLDKKDGSSKNKFSQGNSFVNKVGAVGAGVTSIFTNTMGQIKSVPSEDMMLTEAGHSNSSVMGVNFTQQNGIDGDKYLKENNSSGLSSTISSTASGAAAGASVGGPWGAVIGGAVGLVSGIFGWSSARNKLKKRIWNSQQLAQRTNTFNRSSAMSTGLSNQYYNQNGNTTDDVLYANRGKDANYKFLKRPKYE